MGYTLKEITCPECGKIDFGFEGNLCNACSLERWIGRGQTLD